MGVFRSAVGEVTCIEGRCFAIQPCNTARPNGVWTGSARLGILAAVGPDPAGEPRRRVPAAHGDTTTDKTGRVVLRWQSRQKAHVSLSGVCSDDLAVRLQVMVERALRAAAIHLVVNSRGTTGASVKLDDVIAWTGRRLWARRGSLTLQTPRPDSGA
jgi:hypothetical protein